MKLSLRLKNRVKSELGIEFEQEPFRIWGFQPGSCRWFASDNKGNEYLSFYKMSDCIKAERLICMSQQGERNKFFIEVSTNDQP